MPCRISDPRIRASATDDLKAFVLRDGLAFLNRDRDAFLHPQYFVAEADSISADRKFLVLDGCLAYPRFAVEHDRGIRARARMYRQEPKARRLERHVHQPLFE